MGRLRLLLGKANLLVTVCFRRPNNVTVLENNRPITIIQAPNLQSVGSDLAQSCVCGMFPYGVADVTSVEAKQTSQPANPLHRMTCFCI